MHHFAMVFVVFRRWARGRRAGREQGEGRTQEGGEKREEGGGRRRKEMEGDGKRKTLH